MQITQQFKNIYYDNYDIDAENICILEKKNNKT